MSSVLDFLSDIKQRGIVIDPTNNKVWKYVSHQEYFINNLVKKEVQANKLHFVLHYDKAFKIDNDHYILEFPFIQKDVESLNFNRLPKWEMLGLLYSIIFGIMELASELQVIHMDLKPDNIRIIERPEPLCYKVRYYSSKTQQSYAVTFHTKYSVHISDFGETAPIKTQIHHRNTDCVHFFDFYKFFNVLSTKYNHLNPIVRMIQSKFCPKELSIKTFHAFVDELYDFVGNPPPCSDSNRSTGGEITLNLDKLN